MRRMEKRGIMSKTAFISGARDAIYGLKNRQMEIQRKLNEIEKLEIESRDINPSNELLRKETSAIEETHLEKIQRLKNEVAIMREAYRAGGEMAMLHPNENHYELLSEYLGGSESQKDLQQEIEAYLYEMQKEREQRRIKKPQVQEVVVYSPITKKDRLKERLKIVGAIIGLLAIMYTVSCAERNLEQNNDPERAPKQETTEKYSNFRNRMSENSGEFTQNDGTTYTYNIPKSYYDRQQDGR